MKKSVIFIVLLLVILPIATSKEISHAVSKEEILVEGEKVRIPNSEHYVYGVTGKEAVIQNNEITYYHSDHLGSNSLVTDENGEKVEENKYLPFGEIIGTSDERFGFTGKELDSSDLHYTGARYYDSDLGRFTTVDPIKDGLNHYVYVSNNPLKYVDPSGLEVVKAVKAAYDYNGALTPWFENRVEEFRSWGYTVEADTVSTVEEFHVASTGGDHLLTAMHGTALSASLSDSVQITVNDIAGQEYSQGGGWCIHYSCSGADPSVENNMATALSQARGGDPVQGLIEPVSGRVRQIDGTPTLVSQNADFSPISDGLTESGHGRIAFMFQGNYHRLYVRKLDLIALEGRPTFGPSVGDLYLVSAIAWGGEEVLPFSEGDIMNLDYFEGNYDVSGVSIHHWDTSYSNLIYDESVRTEQAQY